MLRHVTLPNVASVMTLIFSGLILYLMFFPIKVVEVYNNPLPMTKSVFEPGEIISYNIKFCRSQTGYTSIIRKLVYEDKAQVRSFSALSSLSTKSDHCPETVTSLSTNLPTDSPCGRAHLELLYLDRPTILQVGETQVRTQTFQICSQPQSNNLQGGL